MPKRLPPPPLDAFVTVRALDPGDFALIEALFGANGACGGCWCMYWRLPGGKVWAAAKGDRNKADFRALVESGAASGVLALYEGEPVGWAAVGPRTDFVRVERSRALGRDPSAFEAGSAGVGGRGVAPWSLNCFYIPARWRGRGVATALLAGAVELARGRGATEVEAYPVTAKEGKVPAAFAYTGLDAMFEKAGFRLLDRPGLRPVWALALAAGGEGGGGAAA